MMHGQKNIKLKNNAMFDPISQHL